MYIKVLGGGLGSQTPAAELFGRVFHLPAPESKGKKNFELDLPLAQGLFISLHTVYVHKRKLLVFKNMYIRKE